MKDKPLTTENTEKYRVHRENCYRLSEERYRLKAIGYRQNHKGLKGFAHSLQPIAYSSGVTTFLCASVTLWYMVFCVFAVSASQDLTDYAGVIHIHTKYSDGLGTIEGIAKIANRQNLDFIIITDHNTLKPLTDGKEGIYKNTLVLIGDEVSTRAGHYIALNINKEIDTNMPTQEIINEVQRQGGLGFIAHPYWRRKKEWKNWDIENFTGLEIYNISATMLNKNKLSLLLKTLLLPQHIVLLSIHSYPDKAFSRWDRFNLSRKTVAIVGNDAHGKRLFFIRFDPYDAMFAFGRTHILADRLSKESIYEALKKGHSYGSIDALGDPNGFNFVLKKDEKVACIMGDEVQFSPSLNIEVELPKEAKIRLLKDGNIIKEAVAKSINMDVPEKGVYRAEVFKKNRLWIFSNPIYIR